MIREGGSAGRVSGDRVLEGQGVGDRGLWGEGTWGDRGLGGSEFGFCC